MEPKYPLSWDQRALVHFNLGRTQEALADWSKALELGPRNPKSWLNRGCAHRSLGDLDTALADLSRAIELGPRMPQPWRERAETYRLLGRHANGLADASKGIELAREDAQSWHMRACVYADLGQWAKAASDWRKAVELQPGAPYFRYSMILSRLGRGDVAGYRTECARMLEDFGNKADTAYWVAWTCILAPRAVADLTRPVQLAQLALRSQPKSMVHLGTLGAALYRAGRFEEAIRRLTEANGIWEKAGGKGTSSPAYGWFFLAMAHHRLGNAEEARKWLDRAVQRVKRATNEKAVPPPPRLPWNRRLTFELLRREAEALIGQAPAPRK